MTTTIAPKSVTVRRVANACAHRVFGYLPVFEIIVDGEAIASTLNQMGADQLVRSLRDDEEINHNGYTRAQLRAAFALVADAGHWKNPVRSMVVTRRAEWEELAKRIETAVEFFTGSVATINTEVLPGDSVRIYVEADGYFRAIGA